MLGAVVVLFSAFSFALSDVLVRRGVVRATGSQGAFVTVLLGVPLFTIAALITGQLLNWGHISAEGYFYLSAAGAIHYVIGRQFNYSAISAIGATRAAPVQALGLPYSVLVAFLFLDEGITLGMALGIALVMVGPPLMVERSRRLVPVGASEPAPVENEGIQLRQAEGYLFALIAAISYGSSPVLIRAAIEGEAGLSILGGLVSYVAASALLLLSLLYPSRRELVQALQPDTVRVFMGAGVAVGMAQLFRFVALSLTSVAVVATLLRFGSVFTLMLSWMVNRQLERITWRVVAGISLSVMGAVLIVLTRAG